MESRSSASTETFPKPPSGQSHPQHYVGRCPVRWPVWAAGVPEVPCEVPACSASECHLLMAEAPLCQSCPPVPSQDGGQHQAQPSSPHQPASDHLAAQHLQTPSRSATSTSVQGDTRHHVLPEGDCQPLPCGYPWRSGASRGHFLPCPWICHRALSHPQNAEVPGGRAMQGLGRAWAPT